MTQAIEKQDLRTDKRTAKEAMSQMLQAKNLTPDDQRILREIRKKIKTNPLEFLIRLLDRKNGAEPQNLPPTTQAISAFYESTAEIQDPEAEKERVEQAFRSACERHSVDQRDGLFVLNLFRRSQILEGQVKTLKQVRKRVLKKPPAKIGEQESNPVLTGSLSLLKQETSGFDEEAPGIKTILELHKISQGGETISNESFNAICRKHGVDENDVNLILQLLGRVYSLKNEVKNIKTPDLMVRIDEAAQEADIEPKDAVQRQAERAKIIANK